MTSHEKYSGLFVAKNKVEDILFFEVCSRIGAPGIDASQFSDWKMTPDAVSKLSRVLSYLRSQLREQFLESLALR